MTDHQNGVKNNKDRADSNNVSKNGLENDSKKVRMTIRTSFLKGMAADFTACIDSSFAGILGVFAGMAFLETAWVLFRILISPKVFSVMADSLESDQVPYALCDIVSGPILPVLFTAALMLCIYLCSTTLGGFSLKGRKSKAGYLVRRLPQKQKTFYLVQGIYTAVCMLFLLCLEILLFFLWREFYFLFMGAENCGTQDLFLIFYEDYFASALFPVYRPSGAVFEGMVILAAGLLSGYSAYRRSYQKHGVEIILAWPVLVMWVRQVITYKLPILTMLAVIALLICLMIKDSRLKEDGGIAIEE